MLLFTLNMKYLPFNIQFFPFLPFVPFFSWCNSITLPCMFSFSVKSHTSQSLSFISYSLTLNKLRQKQMLEEKLEKRRKMKMEKLQQKHENENKVCEELNIFFVVSESSTPVFSYQRLSTVWFYDLENLSSKQQNNTCSYLSFSALDKHCFGNNYIF